MNYLLLIAFCLGGIYQLESARTTIRNKKILATKSSIDQKSFNDQKLRDELNQIFTKLELSNLMMYRMISDVNSFVIFDCEKPSYIGPDNQLILLKNHIINYDIERRKDPRIKNESSAYMCDKNENIWRVNPDVFKSKGFIGFDHDKAAEADSNFIVLADEKAIKDYFINIDKDGKITKKAIELAFSIIHHPKYYKVDKTKKSKLVDVFAEQDKKIPKWLRDLRSKQINDLYEKLTVETKNFTIPKQSSLKEDTFGDGYSFIIFDCKEPSILHPTNQLNKPLLEKLNSSLFNIVLKKVGHCSEDNIWRQGKKPDDKSEPEFFLTFDAKGQGLGFSPSIKLLKIMKIKGMCDDYMKYLYHPAYYLKNYKKPEQCTSSSVEKEEEDSIKNILDEHFNKKSTKKNVVNDKKEMRNRKKVIDKKTTSNKKLDISEKLDSVESSKENSSSSSSGFESE
ncbi:unnamed protein product [Brachionus calyciflorus]|uniref:Uncharacterized protein n=1 Tax=Brachionus calyciflorus TaxID=104777 RepID=A0A813Y6G0_9BILA|nr:unnamed protein product [Brachionus calyciflorus]